MKTKVAGYELKRWWGCLKCDRPAICYFSLALVDFSYVDYTIWQSHYLNRQKLLRLLVQTTIDSNLLTFLFPFFGHSNINISQVAQFHTISRSS